MKTTKDRNGAAHRVHIAISLGATVLLLVVGCIPQPQTSIEVSGTAAVDSDLSAWGEYGNGETAQNLEAAPGVDGQTEIDLGVFLIIVNHGPDTICDAYVAQDADEGWGDNRLAEFIESQQGAVIQLEPGTYDLLLRDCEGIVIGSREQQDITRDITWTLIDESAARVSLTITNHLDGDLCEVQISPPESAYWGGSWLIAILEPEETTAIDVPQGIYDLKALGCELEELVLPAVNLTTDYEWEVSIEEDPDCGNALCSSEEYFTMSCLRDCAGEVYATMMIVNESGTSMCAFEINDNTNSHRYEDFEILDNAHANFPVPFGGWFVTFEDCLENQVDQQYLQVVESFTVFVRQY